MDSTRLLAEATARQAYVTSLGFAQPDSSVVSFSITLNPAVFSAAIAFAGHGGKRLREA